MNKRRKKKLERLVPDVVGTGDLHCPCGFTIFTCFEALEVDCNIKICDYCGSVLEIIEENPNWTPE